MATPVTEDAGEAGRRRLVAQLAQRGTEGYSTRDVSTQPSHDFEAAQNAALAASPVDLGAEATADLQALTAAPTASGDKYAEAQRAIFAEGQAREGVYGNQFYDDSVKVNESTNSALERYREALAADAAARAAGRGGGSRSGGGVDTGLPDGFGDLENVGGSQYWTEGGVLDQQADDVTRLGTDHTVYAPAATVADDQQAVEVASELMGILFNKGHRFESAIGQIRHFLTRNNGLPTDVVDRIIADLMAQGWREQFNQDPRGASLVPEARRGGVQR